EGNAMSTVRTWAFLVLLTGCHRGSTTVTADDAKYYLEVLYSASAVEDSMRPVVMTAGCSRIPACAGVCGPLLLAILQAVEEEAKSSDALARKPECQELAATAGATIEQRRDKAKEWGQKRFAALAALAKPRLSLDAFEQEEFDCKAAEIGAPGFAKCNKPPF